MEKQQAANEGMRRDRIDRLCWFVGRNITLCLKHQLYGRFDRYGAVVECFPNGTLLFETTIGYESHTLFISGQETAAFEAEQITVTERKDGDDIILSHKETGWTFRLEPVGDGLYQWSDDQTIRPDFQTLREWERVLAVSILADSQE
ncbi:MAG: hypothetical protein IIT36_02115 [Aeriscardovia sp.]|nr:hypothetical protein [Aeriscardovia sp.]